MGITVNRRNFLRTLPTTACTLAATASGCNGSRVEKDLLGKCCTIRDLEERLVGLLSTRIQYIVPVLDDLRNAELLHTEEDKELTKEYKAFLQERLEKHTQIRPRRMARRFVIEGNPLQETVDNFQALVDKGEDAVNFIQRVFEENPEFIPADIPRKSYLLTHLKLYDNTTKKTSSQFDAVFNSVKDYNEVALDNAKPRYSSLWGFKEEKLYELAKTLSSHESDPPLLSKLIQEGIEAEGHKK